MSLKYEPASVTTTQRFVRFDARDQAPQHPPRRRLRTRGVLTSAGGRVAGGRGLQPRLRRAQASTLSHSHTLTLTLSLSHSRLVLRQEEFSVSELEALSLDKAFDPLAAPALELQGYYPLCKPGERFPVNDPQKSPVLDPKPPDRRDYLHAILHSISKVRLSLSLSLSLSRLLSLSRSCSLFLSLSLSLSLAWSSSRETCRSRCRTSYAREPCHPNPKP